MRTLLLAVAVLCVGTMAFAGPNEGGTLIAHDANLLMSQTDGNVSICGQGSNLDTCEHADTEIDNPSQADPSIFKVYAAFRPGTSPRLMGLTWGVTYDQNNLVLPYFGKCGDFELNDEGWPGSGTGSTVTWNTVQTALLVPVYWFAAYTYGAPGVLQLGPNPTQGGYFGDDSIPAILDPIACFGSIGFDTPGQVCCPTVGQNGACCDPATGLCTLTTPDQCQPPMVFHPEFTSCTPNPCPQPPTFGACCNPTTGECTLTTEADCTFNWHPEFTSCDPNPCPQPPTFGACCNPTTGECTLTTEADCAFNWHPEFTTCNPNPCPQPTPAERNTWGQIKSKYR